MIAEKCRGALSIRKIESHIRREQPTITPHKRYCREVLKYDLIQADFSKHELTKRFNVYLNFTITARTNSSVYKLELTNRQEEIYELIKPMHDSGLGYKGIAKRLT